jgi:NifU-like protein involved in Fe-S cluster formation
MTAHLYNRDILRLATSLAGQQRLARDYPARHPSILLAFEALAEAAGAALAARKGEAA